MIVLKKFLMTIFAATFLFCAGGCGSDNSDLGFTSEEFIRKYNAEIDRLARSQKWDFVVKGIVALKIVNDHHGSLSPNPDMSQGIFEFDRTNAPQLIRYGKESADAQKINWLNGSLKPDYFHKEGISAFFDAVAVAVTSGGKGDTQKISEALNNFNSSDVFLEDDGIVVAVEWDGARGEKNFYIASSVVAQYNEKIIAIKEAAKRAKEGLPAHGAKPENCRNDNEPPTAVPGKWFNTEIFIRKYNAAIDKLAEENHINFDVVKIVGIDQFRELRLNFNRNDMYHMESNAAFNYLNATEDKDVMSIGFMSFFDYLPEPYAYAVLYASVSAFPQFRDLDFAAIQRLVFFNEGPFINVEKNGLRLEVRRNNAL